MGVKNFNVMSLGKAKLLEPSQLGYQDSVDIIYDELVKTKKSFIKIGWYLKHIHDNKMYEEDGYSNIYELARDKFNISQPTATRFMQLCEEFSINHNSPELDEKYVDYNVSQLFEMLPMKQGRREQITSDMTVKEIREKKAEDKKFPSDKVILKFYERFIKGRFQDSLEKISLRSYLIEHHGKSYNGGGDGKFNYQCSLKGIKLNSFDEITWTSFVNKLLELLPQEENEQIQRQTSIEEGGIRKTNTEEEECLDEEVEETTETIIAGTFREIKDTKMVPEKNLDKAMDEKTVKELISKKRDLLNRFQAAVATSTTPAEYQKIEEQKIVVYALELLLTTLQD